MDLREIYTTGLMIIIPLLFLWGIFNIFITRGVKGLFRVLPFIQVGIAIVLAVIFFGTYLNEPVGYKTKMECIETKNEQCTTWSLTNIPYWEPWVWTFDNWIGD